MNPEDAKSKDEVDASHEGIHPEPPPFEPGYQPGTVPEITVPDLAEDAVGVSAEVLAEAAIPTLTEQVETLPVKVTDEVAEPVTEPELPDEIDAVPQEPVAQADTWHEQMQVRMTKLTGEIQTLNDRLDRLEQRAKTKA